MSTEPQRGLRRSAPQPGPRLLGVPVPPRALGFGAGWHTWSAAPLGPTRSVGLAAADETVARPQPAVADGGRVRFGLAPAPPAGPYQPSAVRAAA